MDWQTKGEDKLDNLPKRERMLYPDDGRDHYRGMNYPYDRVEKWLRSQVGQHIDKVFSRFVHLDWIARDYRNLSQLKRHVELDTFIEEGEICYYDRYSQSYGQGKPFIILKECHGETLYVHPLSRCLKLFKNNKRFNYAERERFALRERLVILGDYHQYYKKNGIWYEIKAEPRPAHFLPWPGRDERKGPRDILMEPNNAFTRRVSTNPYVKIVLKRQLNHEELLRHSLENDRIVVNENDRCKKCGGYGRNCVHHRTINY